MSHNLPHSIQHSKAAGLESCAQSSFPIHADEVGSPKRMRQHAAALQLPRRPLAASLTHNAVSNSPQK